MEKASAYCGVGIEYLIIIHMKCLLQVLRFYILTPNYQRWKNCIISFISSRNILKVHQSIFL
jgi:hypothetical protein